MLSIVLMNQHSIWHWDFVEVLTLTLWSLTIWEKLFTLTWTLMHQIVVQSLKGSTWREPAPTLSARTTTRKYQSWRDSERFRSQGSSASPNARLARSSFTPITWETSVSTSAPSLTREFSTGRRATSKWSRNKAKGSKASNISHSRKEMSTQAAGVI